VSRTALSLLAALAALAVALVAWHRSAPPPSDEERIRALFAEAARAAGEKRAGDAVAGLSERFRGAGGWEKRDVQRAIAGQVLRGEWLTVAITSDRVEVSGDRAHAAVHLVAARSGKGKALAGLLPGDGTGLAIEAELEREGSEWKIVSAVHRSVSIAEALAPAADPRR
jgi:hypothetical protein